MPAGIAPAALERVEAAIESMLTACEMLASAKRREMELEGARSQVKSEAIARLMALEDPQKPGKTYSATAAADIVMNDSAFALHAEDQRSATAATIYAMGRYEAAKLRARFAVARSEYDVLNSEPVSARIGKDHTVTVG